MRSPHGSMFSLFVLSLTLFQNSICSADTLTTPLLKDQKAGFTGSYSIISPYNLMEDKSRLSIGPSGGGDYGLSLRKFRDDVMAYERGGTTKEAVQNSADQLIYSYDILKKSYISDPLFSVGTTVSIDSKHAPVYSSSLILSSSRLSLDLAYQRTYGERRTLVSDPIIRSTPDGDSISFRLDLIHPPLDRRFREFVRALDDYERLMKAKSSKRPITDQPGFIKPNNPTLQRPQVMDLYPQGRLYNSQWDYAIADIGKKVPDIDVQAPGAPDIVKGLEADVLSLGLRINNNEPDQQAAEKLRVLEASVAELKTQYDRNAKKVRVAVIGGYANYSEIGAFTNAGISVSHLAALNAMPGSDAGTKDYTKASGLLYAVSLQGVWFQPDTRLRLGNISSSSSVRLGAAIALQDRFPHFATVTYIKNGKKMEQTEYKKWTRQFGVEYNRSDVVDGEDFYGVFGRWRNHYLEFDASAGWQAASGTTAQFGLIYCFH